MKILLSAYGCSPIQGSEPGVGWHWALELSSHHEVTILTHPFFKEAIDSYLSEHPEIKLDIAFHEPIGLGRRRKKGSLNSRLYYLAWQASIVIVVKKLLRTNQYDVIHHITWGTFRFPSLLGFLGVPLVFGPVGGGEVSPLRLLTKLSLYEVAKEALRSLSIFLSRFDPFVIIGALSADLILCKTEETRQCIPAWAKRKTRIAHEIGAPAIYAPKSCEKSTHGPLKLLYAGRLIGWKGIHLALSAVAEAHRAGACVKFAIVGSGGLRQRLEAQAEKEGIASIVTFEDEMTQTRLFDRYRSADVFLFLSLHDSSGNVVVEALSRGLPVICLDLGGPKYFVNSLNGRVVTTSGRSQKAIISAVSAAIYELASDRALVSQMRSAALISAESRCWSNTISRTLDLIEATFAIPRPNRLNAVQAKGEDPWAR